MKTNFQKLMKHFKIKHNLKYKGSQYTMVADQLGITERHLQNILSGKSSPSEPLKRLAKTIVRDLIR